MLNLAAEAADIARICKRYHSGALESFLILKDQSRNKKGSHLAVLEGVERKLLCSKFNLEAEHHYYSEFAIQKRYHSGVLESFLILKG
jgi:hypothetical protein